MVLFLIEDQEEEELVKFLYLLLARLSILRINSSPHQINLTSLKWNLIDLNIYLTTCNRSACNTCVSIRS